MTTLTQLRINLQNILCCEYDELVVQEFLDTPVKPGQSRLKVIVERDTLDKSMFDESQFDHIIDSLTPSGVVHKLEIT